MDSLNGKHLLEDIVTSGLHGSMIDDKRKRIKVKSVKNTTEGEINKKMKVRILSQVRNLGSIMPGNISCHGSPVLVHTSGNW